MRQATYTIDQRFLNRWSPRAMSGEAITKEELFTLFEAARWAPSCFNEQPWRFVYAMRDTPFWEPMFATLVPFNQEWAQRAGALVAVISSCNFALNGKPSRTHSFDTGAAWMNLALQGTQSGLVVHGMEGFDYEALRATLQVPDEYAIEAMAAIGRPGDASELPPEMQEREMPSGRKELSEIVFHEQYTSAI